MKHTVQNMEFMTRFKELLEFDDISANNLCKTLKINHTSIYLYLKGSYPSVQNAVKMANHFNCSLNYLLGLSDNANDCSFCQTYDISLFLSRYNKLLESKHTTHYYVQQALNFGNSAYQKWKLGKEPKIETLIKIARHFGCSVDYLIGRSNDIGSI